MVFKFVAPDTVNEVAVVPANVVELDTVKLYNVLAPVTEKATTLAVENDEVPCEVIPFPMYMLPAIPIPPFNMTHPVDVDVLAVVEVTAIDDDTEMLPKVDAPDAFTNGNETLPKVAAPVTVSVVPIETEVPIVTEVPTYNDFAIPTPPV